MMAATVMTNGINYLLNFIKNIKMKLQDLLTQYGFLTVSLPTEDIQVQQILLKDPQGGLTRWPDKIAKAFEKGDMSALPFTKEGASFTGLTCT